MILEGPQHAVALAGGRWRWVGLEVQGFRNSGREELRNGATTASCSKNWPPASLDTRLQPRISKEQVKYHLGQLGQGKNGGGVCLSTSSAARPSLSPPKKCPLPVGIPGSGSSGTGPLWNGGFSFRFTIHSFIPALCMDPTPALRAFWSSM